MKTAQQIYAESLAIKPPEQTILAELKVIDRIAKDWGALNRLWGWLKGLCHA